MPKTFPVSELIGKIEEIKLVAPYTGINRDLAIMHMLGSVHESYTIKESSKIKNSAFCKMSQCNELLATIESLQYLKRIFEKMNKRDKVLATEKLLNKYEKMRVFRRTMP